MKYRTAKKVLRQFERCLAYDTEEYFSHTESATSMINGEDRAALLRSSIILLIEKLRFSSDWPFRERWIEGVGWSSMVATGWGRVNGLGECWWGDTNDFSAGLVPEPLQIKLRLSSLQKRKPISYWIKFGFGDNCHRIFDSNGTNINSYLVRNSNERNEFAETPLMQAASEGNIVIVSSLLAKREDVNNKTLDGFTSLMLAAMFGHKEVSQILLSSGANTNIQTKDGVTALMLAARFGHLDIVDKLLTVGCNVGFKDQYGQTALRLAHDRMHMESRPYNEIVKLLRKAGAAE
ncbi:MAG: ankyrin repeat domain-containing protein [Nitrososphaera sp.]|nr:ankyrin repeat domain-containing protein [Nitrososphaera sp.]